MTTYLLLHGSWHGGWCWKHVASRLGGIGHEVHAPTLPGCAERAHMPPEGVTLAAQADEVIDYLYFWDLSNVVLVGHSSSGMILQAITDRRCGRIASMIYLDGYLLPPGHSAYDQWPESQRAEADAALRSDHPFRPPLPTSVLGIDEPELAQWAERRLRPHPLAAYLDPVPQGAPEVGASCNAYVHCTRGAAAAIFAPMAQKAASLGWAIRRLDASHEVMLTNPNLLVQCLTELAEASNAQPVRLS